MDERWRARRLLESPHRLGFAAAAAVMATGALGWALWLAGSRVPTAAGMPSGTAHGLLFVFGFMPLFFAGFLFTVGPRWLGRPMDDAQVAALMRSLSPSLLAYALPWLLWWPAWAASSPLPAAALAGDGGGTGTVLLAHAPAALLAWAALAWGRIVQRLARLRRGSVRDSPHLRAATAAAAIGAVLLGGTAAAAASSAWGAVHALTLAALWAFCGGVFASAAHRMLPLDTMADQPRLEARHPLWLLALMAAALGLQALDAVAAAWWPLPAAWSACLAMATAGAAAWLGQIAWRWAHRQHLGRQLVAMLHAGLAWLVVALALQAAAHALSAIGRPGAVGLAPTHALALGWMGSTLFAMVSRVAGVFGGQPRAADATAWHLFGAVQLAVLARLATALWPGAPLWLETLAAAAWAGAGVGWLVVYGRWLGLPQRQRGT